MTKRLMMLVALLVAGWVVGSVEAQAQTRPKPKSDDGWFLFSWKDPILTLHHNGYLYVVKCGYSYAEALKVTSESCSPAADVGTTLPNFHVGNIHHLFVSEVSLAARTLTIYAFGPEGTGTSDFDLYHVLEVTPLPTTNPCVSAPQRKETTK